MYAKLDPLGYLDCIVAIGSNQELINSSSSELVTDGLSQIADFIGTVTAVSRFFETPAFPIGSGPNFVNAVLVVRVTISPASVLAKLHEIENNLGRLRAKRWGQRTIDLDLIAVDQAVVPNLETYNKWRHLPFEKQLILAPDQLILPHPRMQDRAFVLGPLMDICPEWSHPVLQSSVASMYSELAEEDRTALKPV